MTTQRIQLSAMRILHVSAEQFMSEWFLMANLIALNAKRETVMPKDFQVVGNLRELLRAKGFNASLSKKYAVSYTSMEEVATGHFIPMKARGTGEDKVGRECHGKALKMRSTENHPQNFIMMT